jgi:DNA-binding NarL/FixJ family response regulator
MMRESSTDLRIYVVEDSPIMLRLLSSAIDAAGAKLSGHSANAQQAIEAISVLEPDLILIDISLNFGNGFDVLRVLRDRGLALTARKVVLTNHANAEYRNLCFRLGADQFLDKASETAQALALISNLATEHRARLRAPPFGDEPKSTDRH